MSVDPSTYIFFDASCPSGHYWELIKAENVLMFLYVSIFHVLALLKNWLLYPSCWWPHPHIDLPYIYAALVKSMQPLLLYPRLPLNTFRNLYERMCLALLARLPFFILMLSRIKNSQVATSILDTELPSLPCKPF